MLSSPRKLFQNVEQTNKDKQNSFSNHIDNIKDHDSWKQRRKPTRLIIRHLDEPWNKSRFNDSYKHSQASRRVDDLFEDLRDGHNLLSLLEVLSGEHLVSIKLLILFRAEIFIDFLHIFILKQPREKGKMRFHMLQNVQMALDFLRYKKIKLVNIRAEDIVDSNPKLTLGLIWTIILHFQVSFRFYCPLFVPYRLYRNDVRL